MSNDPPVLIFAGGQPPDNKRKKTDPRPGVAVSWKAALAIITLLIVLFGGAAYGLWYVAMNIAQTKVAAITVALFFAVPVAFLTGHYFGRTEVRGFLSGVDTAVDRIAQAVDLRDGAKINVHAKVSAPQQPRPDALPPGRHQSFPAISAIPHTQPQRPLLTYREASDGEVIDL